MRVIKIDELANGVEFAKRHLIADTDYLRGYVAALDAIVVLSKQHSFDAQEPVVRCIDCLYSTDHPTSDKVKLCTNENCNTEYYPLVDNDGFCSYGEREDGATDG